MLYFTFSNACSVNLTNAPIDDLILRYKLQEWYLMITILPISVLAFLANIISLIIFSQQYFDNSAVRFNLLSISISEIVLQLTVVCEVIIVLGGVENIRKWKQMLITSIIHLALNANFSIRNWNVVLISVARCEVVLWPLSLRGRLIFNKMILKLLTTIIVVTSAFLACMNNLRLKGIICTNLDWLVDVDWFLNSYEAYRYFEIYGIFMFQACLPVIFICISTFVIWIKLRQTTMRSKSFPAKSFQFKDVRGSDAANYNIPKNTNSSKSLISKPDPGHPKLSSVQENKKVKLISSSSLINSRIRTSYLVLFLSLMFCLLQIPTFIITCVLMFHPTQDFQIHPDLFSNSLLVIDSFLNFFVYAASSRKFRHSTFKLLRFHSSESDIEMSRRNFACSVTLDRIQNKTDDNFTVLPKLRK